MEINISALAIYLNKYIASGTILRIALLLSLVFMLLPEGFWFNLLRGVPGVVALGYLIVLDDSLLDTGGATGVE